MSRLAALGVKKAVATPAAAVLEVAAAAVKPKRTFVSPGSFPKGSGVKSHWGVDKSTKVAVPLVSMSMGGASGEAGGGKLSALQRRMQKTTKDILYVTENAADVIQNLLKHRDDSPIGVRVGLKKKGCNGLAYTMDYLYPEYVEAHPSRFGPSSVTQHGVTVFVEQDAFMHVVGTVMDYQIDKASEKFVFLNPNADGECGCGESFVAKKAAAA
eukprot:TRINITY_DN22559_c0_g1_i1.p1 TRINITY_DN22559_c0_g1~~TRINITY_DN22559_c0_g1_i1.p1  ORF type:complete len:213 (+),score=92.83 TRINITY_DN22559_c0_g1_i1:125-763(+)